MLTKYLTRFELTTYIIRLNTYLIKIHFLIIIFLINKMSACKEIVSINMLF